MNSLPDHLSLLTYQSGIDAVDLAQQLIRIDTCQNDAGNVEALELLGRFVASAGTSCELFSDDGVAAGLVVRWGTGPARLALCGHIDTVPADQLGWTRPPLSGAIERSELHGRGSCDMKAALAAMAVALRDVAAADASSLDGAALVVTTAEEVDSAGASALLAIGALDGLEQMVIGEPTRLDLGVSHKGALWLTVTNTGVSAHSSQPERGQNAILETLGWLMPFDELERSLIGGFDDPLLGRPSVSLNILRGGVARNIVPAECTVELDIRTVSGMRHADLIAEIERRCRGGTVGVTRDAPCVAVTESDDFVVRVGRSVERALGQAPIIRSLPYVTDASVLGSLGLVTVFLGPGDERLAHTEDEHVEISDVYRAVRCYTQLLLDDKAR